MKILIVSDFYKPVVNGVVTSILNLKSGLEVLGHEVRILTLSTSGESYVDGDVYYIASTDATRIYPDARFTLKSAKKELADIISWKPDIVHSQNEFSTFFIGRKIINQLSIPNIHTYHTVYDDYTHYFFRSKKLGLKAVDICTKLLGKNVTCIISPTEKIHGLLDHYQVECPVHTVPSGIELDKFFHKVDSSTITDLKAHLHIPEENTILLSVSRLSKEKNMGELINYMQYLKDSPISLVIVGDGPEKDKLQKLITQLHLEDRVTLTGMVPPSEVPTYYQMADLFTSASTSEAQGLTYIEALASGTPLLCKEDDCLTGVLDESKNGYIFKSKDEFLEKLNIFMNRESYEDMKICAQATVEKYSIANFAKSVEEVYKLYYEH